MTNKILFWILVGFMVLAILSGCGHNDGFHQDQIDWIVRNVK